MTARAKRVVWTVPGAAADRVAYAPRLLPTSSVVVFAGPVFENL